MSGPKPWLLLILALTFAVYAPSLANGFTYDDAKVVRVPSLEGGEPNPLIADLAPLDTYFATSYSESHHGVGRGFRPITILSFAVVHALTETPNAQPGEPVAPAWAQHLVNVVLHCFAVWLTFRILALFLGAGVPALLGAAVFGLHALRSDPVISLVGRAELMGYVFGAASLLLYVAALRRTGGERWLRLVGCAFSLFVAVCSKESAAPWIVMIPLAVVALRWQLPESANLPTLAGQLGPWLLALVLPFLWFFALLLNIWLNLDQEFAPAYESNPLWFLDPAARIANGITILGYGLFKVFAPLHLVHDYSEAAFTLVSGLGDPRFLGAFAVLLAVLVAGLVFARRCPLLFLGVAAFFGFTFLTSNVPFGIETVFGERLYYTPALALSLLVAWAAERADSTTGRRVVVGVVAAWCLVGAGLIVKRDLDWRDNRTLFFADAAAQPDSIRIQMTLMQYLRGGDPAIWKQKIDQAHAVNPQAPAPLRELAFFHNSLGDFAAAERFARQGLASDHLDLPDNLGELHKLLATALEFQGKTDEAERELRAAIEIAEANEEYPDPRARLGLAGLFRRAGKPQRAKAELRRAAQMVPGFLPTWDELLFLAQEQKNDADVQALIMSVQRRFPGAPQLALHDALLAHRKGDAQRAFRVFDQAMRAIPRQAGTAEYWWYYVELLARQNRLDQARQIVVGFLREPALVPPFHYRRFADQARRLGIQPK